ISQALKIHGPNFGVSGAPNAGPDAFLIAAAMLADGLLRGLWVVLTGYESEWIPFADGRAVPAPACLAVALALVPSEPDAAGLHLSIGLTLDDLAGSQAHLPLLQLGSFADGLTGRGGKWRLSRSHWLELEPALGPDSGGRGSCRAGGTGSAGA